MFEPSESSIAASISSMLLPFVLGVLLPWLLTRALQSTKDTRKSGVVSSLTDIQRLLSPPSATIDSLVRSRALANVRLVQAFHLTNTFVDPDATLHRRFVSQARKLIPSRGPFGHDFAELAYDIASRWGNDSMSQLNETSIEFNIFIRVVTFKVMISTLFHVDPHNLDTNDVIFVTSGINTLWNLSKTTSTFPPGLLEGINQRLSRWIPDLDNPLDFVIPVYETMWQVVAVGVALLQHDPQATHLMDAYLQNPTNEQFAQWEGSEASVQALLSEIFRLYPPVRRMGRIISTRPRWLHSSQDSYFHRVSSADIYALQRNVTIWGKDANEFKPSRHHPSTLTDQQRSTLLAFGAGGIRCIASNWSPRAAALLIAAILVRVRQEGSGGLEIQAGAEIGSRGGWDGWRVVLRRC